MSFSDLSRSLAKHNPQLYKLWFHWHCFRTGRNKHLPSKGDQLYFDGFPRSGNTYLTAGIQAVFPELRFANHLHAVAPIKIALRTGLPTFILLRKPDDAVVSYMLHVKSPITESSKKGLGEDDLGDLLLTEWSDYYRWVRNVASQVKVILSEKAFSNPASVAELVAAELGLGLAGSHIDRCWRHFHESFKDRDQTKPQGSTSFPSEIRESQKAVIRQKLCANERLPECLEIYHELCKVAANG